MNKEEKVFYCEDGEIYNEELYRMYKDAIKNKERVEEEIREQNIKEQDDGETIYYLIQKRSAFINLMREMEPPEGYVEYIQMMETYEQTQPEKMYKVLKNWGEPIETMDGRELFLNKGDVLTKSQVDEIIREEQCHLYRRDYFEEFFQEIKFDEEK